MAIRVLLNNNNILPSDEGWTQNDQYWRLSHKESKNTELIGSKQTGGSQGVEGKDSRFWTMLQLG